MIVFIFHSMSDSVAS